MSIFDMLKYYKLYGKIKEAMVVNWKTTLAGVGGAIVVALTGYLESHGVTVKDVLNAIVIAALGYFAKDAGVTGGAK